MLLVADVGNTNTVLGLFSNESADVVDHWRAATDSNRTGDEWQVLIDSFLAQRKLSVADVDCFVIGSVVTAVTGSLQRMCARLNLKTLTVNPQTDTGVDVRLENPNEIGADRLANAIAAKALGRLPAIVVDMGTATTLDVIGSDGEYRGGIILPGLGISLDALFDRASALRRIPLTAPQHVVGTSTQTAVQSGATYGYAAQVDGLCLGIMREIGEATVYATGGLSSLITSVSSQIEKHDPWLTLRGFAMIAQRQYNQESQ